MQPKITIITATYNSAATLEQTIQSVAAQSYPNIEYIVIDGGSTDGTVEILRKYDAQIAYWGSEPDRGIYDAFNKGVAHATGDYVQFLGSDDILCDVDTVREVVKSLEKSVDILSCAIWEVDPKRRKQHLLTGKREQRGEQDDSLMAPHPGMFTRREVLLQYPFETSYRIAADYLFVLTCRADTSVHFQYSDQPVVYFSLDGVSSHALDVQDAEDQRARAALGLPPKGGAQQDLKKLLRKLHLFYPIRELFQSCKRYSWQPHHCDWSFCRWCHPKA